MRQKVLEICTAYESGYGHGFDQRHELSNPYLNNAANLDAHEAWQYGFDQGNASYDRVALAKAEQEQGYERG